MRDSRNVPTQSPFSNPPRIYPLVRADGDSRELGIMIRRFDVCPDASRMNSLHQALANKLLN